MEKQTKYLVRLLRHVAGVDSKLRYEVTAGSKEEAMGKAEADNKGWTASACARKPE